MRLTLLCLLLAARLFTACKNSNNTSSTQTATTETKAPVTPESNLGKEQTAELMNVLSAYYGVKDALVASDTARADATASKLLSLTESFKAENGNMPQYTEIEPRLQRIMRGCDSIIGAKGNALEQKRTYFAGVSDAMYKLLKLANLKHGGVYQDYCPMAMNDAGAYWLSAEADIKNPYFGKKMMECGEVRDSL